MATVAGVRTAHATLSSTTVDTVNLSMNEISRVNVLNRSGTATLWFTLSTAGTPAAATPVAAAAETFAVPAGQSLTVATGAAGLDTTQVKVLGNGNDYSVQALA